MKGGRSGEIASIKAREILDSRGNPTVEAEVFTKDGISAVASVPSGASTGSYEAWELRDGDIDRYSGLGVLKACQNIEEKISKALKGIDVRNQRRVDEIMQELDGTDNLRKLGANAVLAVSLSCARAAAYTQDEPLYKYLNTLYTSTYTKNDVKMSLPVPLFNIFNGGKHADTNLDFQEFLIIPGGINRKEKVFAEMVRAGSEIFHTLKEVLLDAGFDTDVGAEGGYAPDIDDTVQAIDMIMEAIDKAGYKAGDEIQLGTDVGASVLYNKDRDAYYFRLLDHTMTDNELIALYEEWIRKYPFIYIEDGLHENDWSGWRRMHKLFQDLNTDFVRRKTGRDLMTVGDDLFVTNPLRLQAGINELAANAVIAKVNQVGTLSKALEFISLAQKNNFYVIVSHRSGETTDDFIADLAVAVGADYLKAGSLSRGERLVKYNRVMKIEEEMEE